MAVTIADADIYIRANCLDVEDWIDSDSDRKTRMLNVAARTLTNKFSTLTIPDNAVYEFSNVLSVKFNDTNKLAQNGIKGFSVAGMAFQFGGDIPTDLSKMIPQPVLDLIGAANGGITLRVRRIGQGVL